jgi:hypothetical protein
VTDRGRQLAVVGAGGVLGFLLLWPWIHVPRPGEPEIGGLTALGYNVLAVLGAVVLAALLWRSGDEDDDEE